jgi:hypothetical protein
MLRDCSGSLSTRRVQQDHANTEARICTRHMTQRPTDKVSGHVPPIYPVNAGGFRPNALVQTSEITAIGKNTLKNQCVDFVARAMH